MALLVGSQPVPTPLLTHRPHRRTQSPMRTPSARRLVKPVHPLDATQRGLLGNADTPSCRKARASADRGVVARILSCTLRTTLIAHNVRSPSAIVPLSEADWPAHYIQKLKNLRGRCRASQHHNSRAAFDSRGPGLRLATRPATAHSAKSRGASGRLARSAGSTGLRLPQPRAVSYNALLARWPECPRRFLFPKPGRGPNGRKGSHCAEWQLRSWLGTACLIRPQPSRQLVRQDHIVLFVSPASGPSGSVRSPHRLGHVRR